MSDQPTPAPSAASEPAADWLTRVAQKRREVGFVVLAIGIAFAIGAVAAGMRAYTPVAGEDRAKRLFEVEYDWMLLTIWCGTLALAFMGGAVFQLFGESRMKDRDLCRLLLMTLGAIAGLTTALFVGLGFAIVWRDAVLGGWLVWKGSQGWKVWIVIAGIFGGLALTFASMQLARPDERASPHLRRMLYGFNAVFTVLLLASILLFLNLLAYAPWGPLAALGKEYSWAQRNLYALGSDSQKVLEEIDKPTRVYAVLPRNDTFYYPTLSLLENCKDTVNNTDRFDFEFLSPDLDRERVASLMDEYHFDDKGLLVVYGSGAGKDSAFVKYHDLQGVADPRSREPRYNGEQVLITEINFLEQGKSRPVIYLTQGNGELDMSGRAGGVPVEKMDLFKKTLELNRFKVKGLQFVAVEKPAEGDMVFAKEVPADAGVLMIAGPREPLPKFALDAIADYLDRRKGKAMIFFDVATGADRNTMVRTGLEEMLKKYNVVVGDNRVMSYHNLRTNPVNVLAGFPKGQGLSGELSRVLRGSPLPFFDTRTVYPAERPTGPYRTESLLEVAGGQVWAEKDLSTEPIRLLTRLTEPGNQKELAQRIAATRRPVTIAVTVSEVPAGGPHAMLQVDSIPQLIVYGDATWLSNAFWGEQGMAQVFAVVLERNLGWLKQRPIYMTMHGQKSDTFLLAPNVSFGRTVFLPGVLMMAGIIGLGAGVWVVRRR